MLTDALRLTLLFAGAEVNHATSPATGGALPGVPPVGVQFAAVLKSELVVPFQLVCPSTGAFFVWPGFALADGDGFTVGDGLTVGDGFAVGDGWGVAEGVGLGFGAATSKVERPKKSR